MYDGLHFPFRLSGMTAAAPRASRSGGRIRHRILVGEQNAGSWGRFVHNRGIAFDMGDLSAAGRDRSRVASSVAAETSIGREVAARAAKTLVLINFQHAGGVLMSADDARIDHLNAVGASASLLQPLQRHIPDPHLRLVPALAIDGVPGAEMDVQDSPSVRVPTLPCRCNSSLSVNSI